MFRSFFPNPVLLFASFTIWSLVCMIFWFSSGYDFGPSLSLGNLFGYPFPAIPAADAGEEITRAFVAASHGPETFWFYQFFLVAIIAYCGFWFWYCPHQWARWSIGGSALIFFTNWFLVQLDVMINQWFGTFYDMVQRALSAPNTVNEWEIYAGVISFLKIALVYVAVAVVFRFFVSHFVFRWRTAMNDYYMNNWGKLRHIEGASQRVQEDTMRFAQITESLGVSLLDSVMTLVAFLPLLWGLSAHVTHLPLIGEVSQGLVFTAILWSVIGTAIVATAGVKLPGIQFDIQKVEAAYRKELVYGEDNTERAQPPSVRDLYEGVRKQYFRLYLHYLYFNVIRITYLQVGNLVPYVALAPTLASGVITFGIMQQIIRAFSRVEGSFQYLINSWTTIVELLSVYKRLRAFEATLNHLPLPKVDQDYLASQKPVE